MKGVITGKDIVDMKLDPAGYEERKEKEKPKEPVVNYDYSELNLIKMKEPELIESIVKTVKMCGHTVRKMEFEEIGCYSKTITLICDEIPKEEINVAEIMEAQRSQIKRHSENG